MLSCLCFLSIFRVDATPNLSVGPNNTNITSRKNHPSPPPRSKDDNGLDLLGLEFDSKLGLNSGLSSFCLATFNILQTNVQSVGQ